MSSEQLQKEGLIGKKLGMTQFFTADGEAKAVTIIQVGPCVVTEIKQQDKHGYSAAQLSFGPKKQQRLNKAEIGHTALAGKGGFYTSKEIRCDVSKLGWQVGQELKVSEIFKDGDFVDVIGKSIGKGFAGVMKRHHMRGKPATRGTHEYRRHVGSIGCRKFPGRVIKNKRMPGHLGDTQVTLQNVKVIAINLEDNLLLVQGGIPGAKGAIVVIRKAVKKSADGVKKAA